MIEEPFLTTADTYIELGKQLAAAGYPWSEVVRLGVRMEFDRWEQTPALTLMSALAFHARDPEVRHWSAKVDDEQLAEVIRIYEELLPVFNLKMRAELSIPDMAVAVSDLISGMVTGARFNSQPRGKVLRMNVDGTTKEWHLCALAAWCIYEEFSEPRQQG
jgi:hypothetical protein